MTETDLRRLPCLLQGRLSPIQYINPPRLFNHNSIHHSRRPQVLSSKETSAQPSLQKTSPQKTRATSLLEWTQPLSRAGCHDEPT